MILAVEVFIEMGATIFFPFWAFFILFLDLLLCSLRFTTRIGFLVLRNDLIVDDNHPLIRSWCDYFLHHVAKSSFRRAVKLLQKVLSFLVNKKNKKLMVVVVNKLNRVSIGPHYQKRWRCWWQVVVVTKDFSQTPLMWEVLAFWEIYSKLPQNDQNYNLLYLTE